MWLHYRLGSLMQVNLPKIASHYYVIRMDGNGLQRKRQPFRESKRPFRASILYPDRRASATPLRRVTRHIHHRLVLVFLLIRIPGRSPVKHKEQRATRSHTADKGQEQVITVELPAGVVHFR